MTVKKRDYKKRDYKKKLAKITATPGVWTLIDEAADKEAVEKILGQLNARRHQIGMFKDEVKFTATLLNRKYLIFAVFLEFAPEMIDATMVAVDLTAN